MPKQRFLNNFTTTFIAPVKDTPTTGTPATELDYGILRVSDGAAGALINPSNGDFYVLTAYKRSGSTESNIEIMRVTAVNNAIPGECRITVQRAQEGTPARAFVSGDYLSLRLTRDTAGRFAQADDLAAFEPLVAAGTTSDYRRGDKTWRDFATDVRAAVLTGLSTATNAAVAATDSVLAAFGKLQAQITAHFGSGGTAHANATTAVAGFMSSTDKTKLDGVAAGATANATDAQLRDRSTHTGSQAISTVTGLQTALDAKANTASPSFTGTATTQGVRETGVTANTGTAYTVDITARTVLDLTLTGNCTFTFPTATAYGQFTLLLRQDATGNRTVTWPSSVRWPGGSAPTITGTAGRTDVISFVADGTYWLGFVGGQNFNRA